MVQRTGRVELQWSTERMGHRPILTTQHYISAATTIDTTAADILDSPLAELGPAKPERSSQVWTLESCPFA